MARLVLDASALIAFFSPNDRHYTWATEIIEANYKAELLTSAITYSEALVSPIRTGHFEKFARACEEIQLQVIDFAAGHSQGLASTRLRTGLKVPDAIVLQLAIDQRAALMTSDAHLAKAAKARKIKVFTPGTRD